jgi:mannose-1-phosphate guanylyltransferase
MPRESMFNANSPRRDLWVVVLAGGDGTRLQAFTRTVLGTERPKQFCRIIGTRSMLRHTWDRAARLVAPERIVTIITGGQERYLEEEVPHGVPGTVMVQPENKETAPGLLLPLLWIARRNPVATVAVLPADHFIWEEDRFEGHMWAAVHAAASLRHRLLLFGVEADGPETGYGWIAPGDPIEIPTEAELRLVRRFWEKPDRLTAARLFHLGHLWNTFILVGGVDAFLGLARRGLPEVFTPLRAIASCLGKPAQAAALVQAYKHIPATNLSQDLLARHPEALAVLVARGVTWCDWGDPDRILRSLRRFDRRPMWLPVYARSQVNASPWIPGRESHEKERDHAAI